MASRQPATLAGRRVLLAHQDPFQASYLANVIAGRGAMIVGVPGTSDAALALLDSDPPPCALVLSGALAGEAVIRHVATERHVAILLLRIARIEPRSIGPHFTLTAPFAGFQVADALVSLLAARQDDAHRSCGPRLSGH